MYQGTVQDVLLADHGTRVDDGGPIRARFWREHPSAGTATRQTRFWSAVAVKVRTSLAHPGRGG